MRPSSLPPEPLRIQLEGALEVLEEGERLYVSLLRQLSAPRWRRRLKSHAGLLAQVRAHEPVLSEALARVERRARQESWPQEHPLRGTLRALRERHARLMSLARARLQRLGSRKDAALGEVLAELEARVLEPAVPLPEASEEVRIHVDQGRALPVLPILLITALELGVVGLFYARLPAWTLGLLAVAFSGAMAAWWNLTSSQFWLTRERLVWRARSGEVVQAHLASLSAGDVELLPEGPTPTGVELRVRGARPFSIRSLKLRPSEWVTLLRALPAPAGDVSPVEDFALVRCALASGRLGRFEAGEVHGLLVLRPAYAAFVPVRYAASLGLWRELLTRVRRLSPQALDRFVWMAVDREEGMYFNPEEVRASPDATGSGVRFLVRGQAVLRGETEEEAPPAAIARLLPRGRGRPVPS